MNKNNSIGAIDKTDLSEQTKFRFSVNQRKSCSQKLNRYVTTFDYIDKMLIVLSATAEGVSIISFTSVIGAPIG